MDFGLGDAGADGGVFCSAEELGTHRYRGLAPPG
jgi:hypothetical protein